MSPDFTLVDARGERIELIARSAAMKRTLAAVERVAASDAAVLLRGETGVGKGLLARLLHARSARAREPFVVVETPGLTAAALDERLEAARRGTLFLDEIADLPLALQPRCLGLVREAGAPSSTESRLVAASNRDLDALVLAGAFRDDLYYRLKVVELAVPPLRARPDDLLPLAEQLLARTPSARARPLRLSDGAREILARHSWPGNVRELRNAVEQAALLADGPELGPELFAGLAAPPDEPVDVAGDSLAAAERRHIARVIAKYPTMEEAARALGIDVVTLWRRRKKYGLD